MPKREPTNPDRQTKRYRIVESRLVQRVCEDAEQAEMLLQKVIRPGDVVRCMSFLADRPTEEFWALLLDGKHRVLAWHQVSVGTLNMSLVHPREVFGAAVRLGAAAIAVAHNHPSGDPTPSREDLAVTKRLRDAGELLGIPLMDHVIIGEASNVSLREQGHFQ